MKRFYVFLVMAVMIFAVSGIAEAGVIGSVFGKVKELFSWQVAALLLTGLVTLFAALWGTLFGKVNVTIAESGKFFDTLAAALEDRKLSVDELKAIVQAGRNVVNPWKKTPEKYQVK